MKKLLAAVLLLTGCTINVTQPTPSTPDPTPVPTASPSASATPAPSSTPRQAISWEQYPENAAWSKFVRDIILKELLPQFNKALDAKNFCPKFSSLTNDQKATLWTELVSATSYYESKWNFLARMTETGMGTDKVTGKQVASEGLLQLSYQDAVSYSMIPQCGAMNYALDKKYNDAGDFKNPKRTILDPYINLNCGVRIMARRINNDQVVSNSKDKGAAAYWSVLRVGSTHKLAQIQSMTKQLAFCK